MDKSSNVVQHEELLKQRGFYYDLYMSQFRRDIDFEAVGERQNCSPPELANEHPQTVSIPHPDKAGQSLGGYLVKPAAMPAPGILVLHEAYGVNDKLRDIANRFASAGYVALAADLFSDGNKVV